MTVDHQASQAWLLPCRAHASARWPSWHDFGASDDQHEERFYWTCLLAWMMSALPAGESQPASACSCRVIATLTDLVCASCLCTQLARHPGGGMSSERSSWMDRDAPQACSTTRWVDWGGSCPRKERYPIFGHVPLAVCRVADDEFCACVRNPYYNEILFMACNLKHR